MAKTKVITRTKTVVKRGKSSNGNGGGHKMSIAMIAGFAPGVIWASEALFAGNFKGAGERMIAAYTGYEYAYHKWTPHYLNYGLVPVIGGLLIHGIASWTGVNNWFRRSRLPIEI